MTKIIILFFYKYKDQNYIYEDQTQLHFFQHGKAMKEEYISVIKNKTQELTELPKGREPILCKWLYKPKFKADGIIDKYKARLVAKGQSQKEGINYEETFAPVAKLNTIRLLITLATKYHWNFHKLDVKYDKSLIRFFACISLYVIMQTGLLLASFVQYAN